mmetsp:Transcript_77080/g.249447  ORF Transcript_77080/g.249447 Transcript_77080/m.249447 type:complete len:209 (-) Transcript_77080:295-921(-)
MAAAWPPWSPACWKIIRARSPISRASSIVVSASVASAPTCSALAILVLLPSFLKVCAASFASVAASSWSSLARLTSALRSFATATPRSSSRPVKTSVIFSAVCKAAEYLFEATCASTRACSAKASPPLSPRRRKSSTAFSARSTAFCSLSRRTCTRARVTTATASPFWLEVPWNFTMASSAACRASWPLPAWSWARATCCWPAATPAS